MILRQLVIVALSAIMILSSSLTALAVENWKQDSTGWWYQNADGSYPTNTWKEISGAWYYFEGNGYMAANKWIGNYHVGSNGAMLTNTTTPDGYQVGADGAWVQGQGQTQNDGIRAWSANANLILGIHEEGFPTYYNEDHHGDTFVIDKNVNSFLFPSVSSNVNPNGHKIWIYGLSEKHGVALGDGVEYTFEYNKDYNLDFTGTHNSALSLAEYCKANDVVIVVAVVDEQKNINEGGNSRVWQFKYATEASTPTGQIGQ